jgi:hypothetical protein
LTQKTPNTQDANSAFDRPPPVPTDRMMASGPEAAKTNPTKPLAA